MKEELIGPQNAAALDEGSVVPNGKMTWDEFVKWAPEGKVEWVDGEVVFVSPEQLQNDQLEWWLKSLLQVLVRRKRLGRVLGPRFLLRLPNRPSGREPDVMFISNANADKVHPTLVDGGADLIIEVISDESVGRDRGEKFEEYEAAGVKEYWLVDPRRRQVEVYCLGDDSLFHSVLPDADGFFRSTALVGLRLQATWLWDEELPAVDEMGALLGLD